MNQQMKKENIYKLPNLPNGLYFLSSLIYSSLNLTPLELVQEDNQHPCAREDGEQDLKLWKSYQMFPTLRHPRFHYSLLTNFGAAQDSFLKQK